MQAWSGFFCWCLKRRNTVSHASPLSLLRLGNVPIGFARSGLAKVGCGAEESRRREPLDAIDAKIDAVGLQLGLGIDALNERRLPGDRGPKLLTR